jgi:phage baseplate assembly protein W
MVVTSDIQTSRELRGLALPAVHGPGGFFESKGEAAVAFGDLLIALFTPIGGRFMNRTFGSALHDLIFETIPEEDFAFVDATIKDAAVKNLPHITVTRTRIRGLSNGKGIEIEIFFRIETSREVERRQTVLIPLTFVSPQASRVAGV